MQEIEAIYLLSEACREPRCPEQPAEVSGAEIPDLNAVDIHGPFSWYIQASRSVAVGREDMDLVPRTHKSFTQPMHGLDGPTVSQCRQVGWNDVKDSHGFNVLPASDRGIGQRRSSPVLRGRSQSLE
jgi:hypothetical protein